MHDLLADAILAPKRPVSVDLTRGGRVHDGARHGWRSLIRFGHLADDGEREGLQPVGVRRLDVVLDGHRLQRVGGPPVVPVEFEVAQAVVDLVQVVARGRVAAVSVQDEDAAESASIRGTDDVLHGGDQRGDAQANGARVFEKIMREAKVQGRRDQHPRLL